MNETCHELKAVFIAYFPQALPIILGMIWEWFLGKQKKIPVNSTVSLLGLIVSSTIGRSKKMLGKNQGEIMEQNEQTKAEVTSAPKNKESKELLIGINDFALLALSVFKDGIQPVADFGAIITKYNSDEAFKAAIDAAIGGIAKVPAEAKEFGPAEMIDLAQAQLGFIPKFLEALK